MLFYMNGVCLLKWSKIYLIKVGLESLEWQEGRLFNSGVGSVTR